MGGRSHFSTYDFKVYSVLKLRCTYLYCTSMSRSALISWSHRMILRSFPPPVRRVPLLISHMQKTLPSWALTCRVIWNAAQTQICLCEPHGIITSHHMSLVLHNLVLVLGLSPLGPFPVVVSLGFLVQTSRTPPESPVRMSPELRKDRHWMNFGFSYFWKKGKETGLRLGLDQALDQFNLDSKGEADLTQDYRHETGLHRNTRKYRLFVLTPKMPCLRASDVPVQVQKKMWDFPQVTMVFGSVGWNSTSRTTSFVVYKSNKKWLRTLKKW